jgi:PPOX class probable F420-dependent enzyme
MTPMFTPEQRAFLDSHQWAVLATTRRDRSPQQSLIAYVVDDAARIVVSTKAYTAKWHNALRHPDVSLTVVDGRAHLVIYGVAEGIDHEPDRAELSADVFQRLFGGPRPEPSSLVAGLDEQRRTILRITPRKVLFQN